MLTTPSVSKISILSRRRVAQAEGHEKAKVFIQKDFTSYDKSVLDELKDAHGVVWAQGISSTQVDRVFVFPFLSFMSISYKYILFNVGCIGI